MASLWRRTLPAVLCAAAILAVAAPAGGQPLFPMPRRVVSLDVCADQLLMNIAEPQQIAALSVDSTDARLSSLAAGATAYPQVHVSPEAVMAYQPDLVLAGPRTDTAVLAALVRLGYEVHRLEELRTVDDAIDEVVAIGALLGHQRIGENFGSFIASARLQATQPDFGFTAAYLAPGGVVAGEGSLVSDLLSVVGLGNAGAALVPEAGGPVPLEELVAAMPDYLVVADAEPDTVDQATALLHHPALDALYPPARRIELPLRLTLCGGPGLADAIAVLAREYRRVNPTSSGPSPN